jgi:hypothetical protein
LFIYYVPKPDPHTLEPKPYGSIIWFNHLVQSFGSITPIDQAERSSATIQPGRPTPPTRPEKASKNNQRKNNQRDYLWKPRSRFPFDLPLTNDRTPTLPNKQNKGPAVSSLHFFNAGPNLKGHPPTGLRFRFAQRFYAVKQTLFAG